MINFNLDSTIIKSKTSSACTSIDNILNNLSQFQKTYDSAVSVMNSCSQLESVITYTYSEEKDMLNELKEKNNRFSSIDSEYSKEVEKNFFNKMESVIESLSNNKLSCVTTDNNIGAAQEEVEVINGIKIYSNVRKEEINIKDIFGNYGECFTDAQYQYEQYKQDHKGETGIFADTNAMIESLITSGDFDYTTKAEKEAATMVNAIPYVSEVNNLTSTLSGKSVIGNNILNNAMNVAKTAANNAMQSANISSSSNMQVNNVNVEEKTVIAEEDPNYVNPFTVNIFSGTRMEPIE